MSTAAGAAHRGLPALRPFRAERDGAARAWRSVFAALEARAIDLAIVPVSEAPLRFGRRTLFEEDFVVVVRAGQPLAGEASVERYCAARHLVVSHTGDPHGFVAEVLARQQRTRRAALTVPNFVR